MASKSKFVIKTNVFKENNHKTYFAFSRAQAMEEQGNQGAGHEPGPRHQRLDLEIALSICFDLLNWLIVFLMKYYECNFQCLLFFLKILVP